MRKLYLDNGNEQFKFADTTTEIRLNAFDDGRLASLTADAKVRIKNDSGYLLEVSASVTNNQAVITSGQLAQLPAGNYLLELWDTVNGGTAIYPSDGFLALQINENVTSLSGKIISSMTVDDFVQKFSDLSQQLKKEVTDAVANGLGDRDITQLDISYTVDQNVGHYIDYLDGTVKDYTPDGSTSYVGTINLDGTQVLLSLTNLLFHPLHKAEIGFGYAFYDEDDKYISGGRQLNTAEVVVVPVNAKTLKITTDGNAKAFALGGLRDVDNNLSAKGRPADSYTVGKVIEQALISSNTLDDVTWENGYFIDAYGNKVSNADYSTSGFIYTFDGNSLYVIGSSRILVSFYGGNSSFVSYADINPLSALYAQKIVVPKGVRMVRFSSKNAPTIYRQPIYQTDIDVSAAGKLSGYFINAGGGLAPSSDYQTSQALLVKPSTKMFVNGNSRMMIGEYDGDGNLVAYNDVNVIFQKEFTTNEKTVFMRISGKKDDYDNIRLTADLSPRTYHVGAGQQFTKIKDAVEEATRYLNSTIYVEEGTYDLVSEYGDDFFKNYTDTSSPGLLLKNGVKLIFQNAKVTFNYDGSNQNVINRFSPFNSGIGGFELHNLDLTCENCRYGVHDERGGSMEPYSSKYVNCDIKNDGVGIYGHYCIGTGLGHNATITVENSIFDGLGVLIHNDNSASDTTAQSKVVIKNSYFVDDAKLEIEHAGASTEFTTAIVTSNSFANADKLRLANNPLVYQHDNVKLYSLNNELRNA